MSHSPGRCGRDFHPTSSHPCQAHTGWCSKREPADSRRAKRNVIGGWPPSLTLLSAILIMTEFSLLREGSRTPERFRRGEATPRPYCRHILGIDSGVQSHPQATPRLHQGSTKAPPRLHQGSTKATPRLHQGYTKATPRLHQGSHKAPTRLPQGSHKAPPKPSQGQGNGWETAVFPVFLRFRHRGSTWCSGPGPVTKSV